MNDHTALIKIVTWFLLTVSGIATAGRLSIKWSTSRKLNLDDVCAVVALVLNVCAGVALSLAANNGLSLPLTTLERPQIEAIQKSLYATGILFILAVAFAKLSIVFLLRFLFIEKYHQAASIALGVFIVAQGFATMLAAIFPCHVPDVWAIGSGHCFNLEAFWRAVGIFHIISDIFLIALPCYMAAGVRMPFKRKAVVASCFGVRILDVAASATQLASTSTFTQQDFTAALWQWYFIGQVILTVTMISSSTPYLRQLLLAFPSGMFQPDDMRRRGVPYAGYKQSSSADTDTSYTLNYRQTATRKSNFSQSEHHVVDSEDTHMGTI